jgi:hypothetical protein
MDAQAHPVLPADNGAVGLIDVLSVPTVGEAVVHCLRFFNKAALRESCSAVCALVSMVLCGLNSALGN